MNDRIPIIDVAPLFDGTDAGVRTVSKALGAACRGIGFFAVTGHPVSGTLIDEAFAAARALFAADDRVKDAVRYSETTGNRGYIPMLGEALDPSAPADLKEAFNIGLELAPDDPELLAGARFRTVNLWPDLSGFRETMLAYFDAAWALGRDLHRAIACDLGMPFDHFAGALDRPLATLRLLHYPPRPSRIAAGQRGAAEHTDYGNITLLATDDVAGLEVRTRDGAWIEAPVLPGGFICNIGDCLMRWTNDTYVSTPHRVTSPKDRHRYAIAFFLDPNPDAVVACLPTCRGAERPAKYPPVRGDDYLMSRLDPTYAATGLIGDGA